MTTSLPLPTTLSLPVVMVLSSMSPPAATAPSPDATTESTSMSWLKMPPRLSMFWLIELSTMVSRSSM
ncbi:MAG: hypothetical protein ABS81_16120 [Pseudonocardia sp. SCN 72-86]|nr:MAG: hypothetical protein ABS81_16120 [Pseudonocardia sp. SCN 72-86]